MRSVSQMFCETVSIVLPVRNAQRWLHSCLLGLEREMPTIFDAAFEVIVVDDASVDRSLIVLDDMRLRFPFLQVILHSAERGLEAAAETGLASASGELLFILERGGYLDAQIIRSLYELSTDSDIVAARYRSNPDADQSGGPTLQMIRRSALARIAQSEQGSLDLVGETIQQPWRTGATEQLPLAA